MRRMSHYLGFYTEILSTKVGIKRSGLIELITIVQVYDHLPTGESTRSSPDKVRLEVVNIAGMYSQARPGVFLQAHLQSRAPPGWSPSI